MNPEGYRAYQQGKVYTSECNGCITDIQSHKDHWWTPDTLSRYFVPLEGTELFDTYGTRLQVGQTVAVTVTDSIVLKGKIVKIDSEKNQVSVEVTWPVGNKAPVLCTSYSRREGNQICMSQILVLDEE